MAGIYGKPIWSFYVNRGQGISSFGVKSKDWPIMEYNTANNAYQQVSLLGFRTFYQIQRKSRKGKDHGKPFLIEPFDVARTRFVSNDSDPLRQSSERNDKPRRIMYIGANELQIQEIDDINNIETNVTYYVLPEEDFPAFVRRTTITNIGNINTLHFSVLDGLARMQPAGGKLNGLLKSMGRTLEGWMGVYQAVEGTNTMPFYRLSTEPTDSAAVVIEETGHYCISYIDGRSNDLLPIVFDTSKVFGEDTMMLKPIELQRMTVRDIVEGPQYGSAKTSSAFAAAADMTIHPGESITLNSFFGRAEKVTDVPVIARRVSEGGFAQYKFSRARELIQQITSGVETNTGNMLFDGHVQQMYLDNSLRGGVPVLLGEVDEQSRSESADDDTRLKVYHLFSRIHGDLEVICLLMPRLLPCFFQPSSNTFSPSSLKTKRDYNDFVLDPTFFSEGPCNFRDVVQNRRNDGKCYV